MLDKYIAKVKKQYAEEGWSLIEYQNELYKMQGEMSDQYSDGKITDAEYQKAVQKIQNALSKPGLQGKKHPDDDFWLKQYKKMLADGSITQGQYDEYVKKLGVVPTKQEKKQSYSDLYDWLVDISDEEIDGMDAMSLTDMVEYLKKSNVDPADAKKQLESAVDLIKNNQFTAEEAMFTAAGYKPGMQPVSGITDQDIKSILKQASDHIILNNLDYADYEKAKNTLEQMKAEGKSLADAQKVLADLKQKQAPPLMSHDEYIGLWEDLNKKKKVGLITQDEWKALGDKLDNLYNGKKTKIEDAQKALNLDPGSMATVDAVEKLGKECKKVYKQAADEMQAKLDAWTAKYQDQLAEMQAKVAAGEMTQTELAAWMKRQKDMQKILENKIDQASGVMLQANQKALSLINGQQLNVFAENANYQSYELTQDAKVNLMFSVYDEDTAAKLLKDKPELLPRKEVNGKKDQAWNQKIIANAVLQAVIQGESIPALAKKVAVQTGETNMKAMIRYARTAMTSAQNSGRMEMLHRAKGMGIEVKKRWLATLDSRTRDVHAKLDGQTVDIDDPFQSELGPIMFPGDMGSKGSVPANLYNCRCTLVYDYKDFPNDPTDNMRLMYEEWDDVWYTTEKDKNGNEYQKEHRKHHREGKLITDMNYDEWKAAKEGSKLNDLNLAKIHLAEVQKDFLKKRVSETKVYKDLWKEDVTMADYPDKKDSIAAKRDYYTSEIEKYNQAKAEGKSWATEDKIDALVKKRKLLDEFEKHGELLLERNKALKDVQDIYDQVGLQKTAQANVAKAAAVKKTVKAAAPAAAAPSGLSLSPAGTMATQFAPDAWDDAKKRAARRFNDKYKADADLRPELDAMWDLLTDEEKYGVWEYTRNSHPMNQPLCGFNDHWGRIGTSNFVGLDKTEWGHQDDYSNRNFFDAPAMRKFGKANGHPSYHKAITKLTNALEKSKLKKGIWLVRGSDDEGLAGLFESGGSVGLDFRKVMDLLGGRYSAAEVKKALVGQTGQNHGFTSTGVASGTGFGGSVKYNIYAPEGTKGIYAEPQSYWGETTSRRIYKKGDRKTGVSREAEIILQRGTRYRITDVRGGPGRWEIDMEVVEQPDYFVNGDENTYNDGKTRQKK